MDAGLKAAIDYALGVMKGVVVTGTLTDVQRKALDEAMNRLAIAMGYEEARPPTN